MAGVYQHMIRTALTALGEEPDAVDPRHIEGWMRLEHDTLDSLTPTAFETEVAIALECVRGTTRNQNEELALSFGLRTPGPSAWGDRPTLIDRSHPSQRRFDR